MKTIHKYTIYLDLAVGNRCRVLMPDGARLLTCAGQRDQIQVWALVETDEPLRERYFEVLPTGEEIVGPNPSAENHIGTAQIHDGRFVFHVFALP